MGLNRTPADWEPHATAADQKHHVIDSSLDNGTEYSTPFQTPSASIESLSSLPMTHKTGLNGLKLHSPSKIVGTPFAVNNSRFEYPFPDTPSSSPAGLADDHRSLPSGVTSVPMSPPLGAFSSMSPPIGSLPSSSKPRYPHPKLLLSELDRDPPVPPSLKQRHTWSTPLLPTRKRNVADTGLLRTASESNDSTPSAKFSQEALVELIDADQGVAKAHVDPQPPVRVA